MYVFDIYIYIYIRVVEGGWADYIWVPRSLVAHSRLVAVLSPPRLSSFSKERQKGKKNSRAHGKRIGAFLQDAREEIENIVITT